MLIMEVSQKKCRKYFEKYTIDLIKAVFIGITIIFKLNSRVLKLRY